jgi:uncharacterized membrane protein
MTSDLSFYTLTVTPPLNFQYNNVCLGLFYWAVALVLSGRHVAAAVVFTLTLGFKQMALYFAPAFFAVMLGQCLMAESMVVKIGTFCVLYPVRSGGSEYSASCVVQCLLY